MVHHAIVATHSEQVRRGLVELLSPVKELCVLVHDVGTALPKAIQGHVLFYEIPEGFSTESDEYANIEALTIPTIGITTSPQLLPSDQHLDVFTEVFPIEELSSFWVQRILKELSSKSSQTADSNRSDIGEIFNRFPIKIAVYNKELEIEFLNEYAYPDPEIREWAIGKTLNQVNEKLGYSESVDRRIKKLKECLKKGEHITWYENFRKEKGLSYQLYGAFPMLNELGECQSLVTYGSDISNEIVAEKSLRFRIGFEKLLIEYSNRFINIASFNLDRVLHQCLGDIGSYVDTDRVYIFRYQEDDNAMSNTHEWCRAGIQPFKEELQQLKLKEFTYLIDTLKTQGLVCIDSLTELPETAEREYQEFLREGIQSILCAPLKVNNKVIGFIGFDSVRNKRAWSQELKDFITLAGQVISNALEREKSESALVNSEEKFRTLTEKAHAAIFITQDFRFVYANPETVRLTGYSEDELLTQNLIEMLDLNEKNSALESGKRIRQNEHYNARNERKILTKSGEVKYIDITSNQIRYNDEEAIISIAFDVTEKHKKDEEEKELIKKLIEQNLDLEQFSYITSHNLRSPVAGIQGLISILEHDKLGSNLNKDVIDRIGIAANKLDVVIKDLNSVITMRNKSAQNRQEVVLDDLLNEIIDTHKEMVEQNEATILRDFYNVPSLHTVKGYLTSIITNLITNAIKYRRKDVAPIIKISSKEVDNTIEITVSDNGLGLDLKKYGQRLFKFKQRFHKNVAGHGMGLYLVRTQANSLGGTVKVESEVGKGSTFTVVLKA